MTKYIIKGINKDGKTKIFTRNGEVPSYETWKNLLQQWEKEGIKYLSSWKKT